MNKKFRNILSVFLVALLVIAFSVISVCATEDDATDDVMTSYSGLKVSILGDSISTFDGVSNNTEANSTIGDNLPRYPAGDVAQADTWWQQAIDILGMELLVNNSWRGTCIRAENGHGASSPGYLTRCVNLHNDSGETPVLPDVIWVFLGTNDFTHFQSTLGTFEAIDYDALIVEGEDGTFTYATPSTSCEAYAIMLHKIGKAYPNAEVFCLNLLPRRVPMIKNDKGPVTTFNEDLAEVIENAGATLVDLENCGISVEPTLYDTFMYDSYVHPNDAGMDLITAALLGEMVGTYSIAFNGTGASCDNPTYYAEPGDAYTANISLKSSYANLQVKVTMGGEDVTDSVCSGGNVNISNITGDVVITATATLEYLDHIQSLPEELCEDVNLWTALEPEKNYFAGTKWSDKYYSITFPVSEGDQIWAYSFGKGKENGNVNGTNGIRTTWFNEDGTYNSVAPTDIYEEFSANGYITVPAGAVAVNVPMWDNDTSSEKVFLLNREHNFEVVSSENGFTVEECSACGLDRTSFDGAVSTDGFAIRLLGYNGLRAIFSFDKSKNEVFEEQGYKLLEYGAIAVPEAKYITDGSIVTIDPGSYDLLTGGKKVAVWSNGKFVGNTLEGREENKGDDLVTYALALTNYTANHADNVYFCAYSIYEDPNGEIVITVKDYGVEGKNAPNLYQTTLDMYVNGAINSSNTDDTAVWDTLLTGVVTLTSSEYGTDVTDMDGNAFGDTFTFKDVYAMKNTAVNDSIKITLFHDYKNSNYVAIFRGTGRINGRGTSYKSQFAHNTSSTKMSHPKLTKATNQKISTYIFDDGITGTTGTYAFHSSYVKTIVFSKTFETIDESTFAYAYGLTSIYQAKATGKYQENEVGLVDLSFITTLKSKNLFYKMDSASGFTKVHLPANVNSGNLGDAFCSEGAGTSTKYKVEKVWCGDTPEPAAGIIDLTGLTNLESISGSSFSSMSSGYDYILILPDSCTALAGSGKTSNAFGYCGLTEIRQATRCADIVDDIAENTYISSTVKYCNLEGVEH